MKNSKILNTERNQGRERCLFLKRTFLITLILSFVPLFIIRMSEAQTPFPKPNRPDSTTDSQRMRMKPPALDFTAEQVKTLENLRHAYMAEAMPMMTELLALRIGLRYLLSDPNIQARILFDHQRKISALQSRLEELFLSYQVKTRSVFTKEQWERLPEGWGLRNHIACSPGGRVKYK